MGIKLRGDLENNFTPLSFVSYSFGNPVYLVTEIPKGTIRICRRERRSSGNTAKRTNEKRVVNANTHCCLHS
jgi:hypothetical protein